MIPLLVTEGFLLLGALLAVAGMGRLFVSRPSAAAWVLVAVFATTVAIIPAVKLQVTLAGFTLYGLDLVTGLMFGIGVVRLVTRPNPPSVFLSLAALSALLTIHVVRGMAEFGLQASITGSRSWLYFIGPLVYATQVKPDWNRESFRPIIIGGSALAGYALIQVAQHGVHSANTYIDVRGQFLDARPVNAVGALLILQCLLIALSARFARSTIWWLIIASMGGAVLLLQHRTVWIVAGLTIVVAYVRWARAAIFVNERAALLATSAILLFAPVAVALTASSNAFGESVDSARGSNSTLAWRTESWTSLVASHHSIEDLALGLPGGTSFERRIDGLVATQSPHSFYVDSYLNLGILGPFTIAVLWALIIRRRRVVAAAFGMSGTVVVLIVCSEAIFGITNMLAPVHGLLLGMLIQAACVAGRGDPTREPRSDRGGIGESVVR